MICSRGILFSCAIIEVFSTRIFRNLDLGRKWLLRRRALELESLRCIVGRLERVVVVSLVKDYGILLSNHTFLASFLYQGSIDREVSLIFAFKHFPSY